MCSSDLPKAKGSKLNPLFSIVDILSLNMRVIAAYMLAVLGGNQNPDINAVKKVLDSVAVKYSEDEVKATIAALAGKNLDELVKDGLAKFAAVPQGGGGSAAPAAAAPAAAPAAGKKEEKAPEKKKEEPKDEPVEEMGLGLFD